MQDDPVGADPVEQGALDFKSPTRIMAHLAEHEPAFARATYEAMGLRGVPLSEVGEAAV